MQKTTSKTSLIIKHKNTVSTTELDEFIATSAEAMNATIRGASLRIGHTSTELFGRGVLVVMHT